MNGPALRLGVVISLLVPASVHGAPGSDTTAEVRPAPPRKAARLPRPRTLNARQTKASQLVTEAGRVYQQGFYLKALRLLNEAYRIAPTRLLAFNIALVKKELGRHVEALAAFETFVTTATAAGVHLVQARLARKLILELKRKISRVRVVVPQAGAVVRLDGERIGVGPLRAERRIMPGTHTLQVSKRGFIARSVRFGAAEGKRRELKIKLLPEPRVRIRHVYRMPKWLPWTMLGVGLAVAAVGIPLAWKSEQDFNAFDDLVRMQVYATGGDVTTSSARLDGLEASGNRYRWGAVGAFVGGGALLAAAVALVFWNRPRKIVEREPAPAVQAFPLISPRGEAGLTVRLTY